MNIALATDHAGYQQITELQVYLESLGHTCVNFGPTSFDKEDDYPDFIRPAAKAVSQGKCERGIILGGSGQGEAIAANRFHGVRCGLFYGPAVALGSVDISGRTSHDPYEIVRLTRTHNDTNMLSLAARFVGIDEMKNVVKIWLDTAFDKESRHQRRHQKIDEGV